MKRTLLAVGFAMLLSMMATPCHRYSWRHWNCWLVYDECQYQPFFPDGGSGLGLETT
jgi:hypothetical protein